MSGFKLIRVKTGICDPTEQSVKEGGSSSSWEQDNLAERLEPHRSAQGHAPGQ